MFFGAGSYEVHWQAQAGARGRSVHRGVAAPTPDAGCPLGSDPPGRAAPVAHGCGEDGSCRCAGDAPDPLGPHRHRLPVGCQGHRLEADARQADHVRHAHRVGYVRYNPR